MVFALDTVRSNQMPNLNNMYNNERNSTNISDGDLPEAEFTFEVKIENDVRQVYRQIQKALTAYKDEKRGNFVFIDTFFKKFFFFYEKRGNFYFSIYEFFKRIFLKYVNFFNLIFLLLFRSNINRCTGLHGFSDPDQCDASYVRLPYGTNTHHR